MPWNEPGNDNSNKPDPWGGQKKKDGPPDLDELLKKLQQKISAFFKKSGGPFSPESKYQAFGSHFYLLPSIIIFILLLIWVSAGFFIVQPAEKGIILFLGRYSETVDPGLHWIPPFLDTKYIVNVQAVSTFSYQAEMLTQDQNIVSVAVSVQYRIFDPKAYLFNALDPEDGLQQATGSALRQTIGNSQLDNILTSGQQLVAETVRQKLVNILSQYNSGLEVMDVNLQSVKPPEEVTTAFDDVIKAREDAASYQNQATAYANNEIANAKGKASNILAAANAYQQQVVLAAQGDTSRFLQILPQYQSAPQVTRERLYLDAMKNVLNNTTKIFLDTGNSNNVIYLPLNTMANNTNASAQNNSSIPLTLNNTTVSNAIGTDNYGSVRPTRTSRPDSNNNLSQGDS